MTVTVSLHDALRTVLAVPCSRKDAETVPLAEALGRCLAEDVVAAELWPATDRSAMDGFALAAGQGLPAGTTLPVAGESLAGKPFAGAVPAGAAIRIMTGAVVPAGVDTVVPVEQTDGFAGATVTLAAAVRAGANIRPRGSEVKPGQHLIDAGRRIRAAEIGALAVLGKANVAVVQKPRVAILATGDEVVPIERTPAPFQVRESNSWALAAQVAEAGGESQRLGVAKDEAADLRALLARGLAEADVLVTIGGISKGTHDLVGVVLAELGVVAAFHGIELKPGKPTFFGVLPATATARAVFVFGLPGNPASAFTVFDLLVRPLLRRLLGQSPKPWSAAARLGGAPWKPNARLQAVPARLVAGPDGAFAAELAPPSPSGDPFGLLPADGYALLPPNAQPEGLSAAAIADYAAGITLP